MNWFAKMIFDGGGSDLKNHLKSIYCLYDFFKKFTNLYKNLTFVAYDKIGGGASRAQEGPGASHSWKFFLTTVCRAIKKIISRTKCRPLLLRATNRGAILVEFAVCMPILIILLFYINDLVKLKRYYSQTEFVAQQAANMIQNISQKRAQTATTEEQRKSLLKISKQDLQHIFTLATLTIYPDNNFCSIKQGHKHGHFGEIFLYYVQGNANGTADVLWGYNIQMYLNALNPSAIGVGPREELNSRSHVKILTGSSPQDIWPTLKIGPDDKKIILEFCIDYTNHSYYKLGNGDGCDTISPSKIFGFNLITPKGTTREGSTDFAYFNSVVIFSPKPGLFDETPPS